MRKLLILLVACTIPVTAAYACTAFFKHERISGMNKICTYNHLGSDYAVTYKSHELCPLTVNARH